MKKKQFRKKKQEKFQKIDEDLIELYRYRKVQVKKEITQYQWLSYNSNINEIEYLKIFLNFNKKHSINYAQLGINELNKQNLIKLNKPLSQIADELQQRLQLYGSLDKNANIARQTGAYYRKNGTYSKKLDNYYDQNDSFIDDDQTGKGNDAKMIVPSAIYQDYCCLKGDIAMFINSKEFQERKEMINRIINKENHKKQFNKEAQQKSNLLFGFSQKRKLFDDFEENPQKSQHYQWKVVFEDQEIKLFEINLQQQNNNISQNKVQQTEKQNSNLQQITENCNKIQETKKIITLQNDQNNKNQDKASESTINKQEKCYYQIEAYKSSDMEVIEINSFPKQNNQFNIENNFLQEQFQKQQYNLNDKQEVSIEIELSSNYQ